MIPKFWWDLSLGLICGLNAVVAVLFFDNNRLVSAINLGLVVFALYTKRKEE